MISLTIGRKFLGKTMLGWPAHLLLAATCKSAIASNGPGLALSTFAFASSPLLSGSPPCSRSVRHGLCHLDAPTAFGLQRANSGSAQSSTQLKAVAESSDDPIKTPREYTSDLVVVLDMDECLVSSMIYSSAYGFMEEMRKLGEQDQRDKEQGIERKTVENFISKIPGVGIAVVRLRPFVREFLEAISQDFETHLYTAGKQAYATEVQTKLDPDGTIFTKAWTRQFCDEVDGAFLKNLGKLKFSRGNHDPKRTVFVDNSIHSFRSNPQNGILVPDFYSDPDDGELQKVLDLIRELDQDHPDVRPFLDERFGIKAKLA